MDLLCKWCNETKPDDLFVKRKTTEPPSQGNVKCCRQCWSIYQKERYKKPELRAKQLRANANWRKAHPEKVRQYERQFGEDNPNQQRARTRIGYLVRRGLLVRRPCEVCLSADVEAHHDSYAQPHWETVRWLCKQHHESWHQRLDPVKSDITATGLKRVKALRDEALEVQRQITALRERHHALFAEADALELSTWNRVVEAAQPMFEKFLTTA